ncbi:2-isopropylmalate synthase [Powellomyces hirtus]|uniref:2-isopropylmalate synthase n=1 Tax=Powellomyces hirtus TaxID=109895 RepID=A0A507DU58_9FUNG|nr:2-isopropylmalate synthase [Powellomyces hirtus]
MTQAVATSPKDKLIIFDTTLRDGEQSPGVTLTASEKVEIAKQLSRLGVDVCEAGFPIASEGDFEAVERIAKEVGHLMSGRKGGKPMVICGLARAVPADIQRAYDAIKHAPLHRVHTFLATSDIHLQYKLKITRDECVARAVAAVKFAKSIGCKDIEFSPEDAGRSDREFLCQVLGAVIKAGATTLNIPDTVGYNTPEEYGAMIKFLVENVESAKSVTWSTHCHNDLGLATANTLAGVANGARQVEVTINGIGERAGNTSLEELVMAIFTHPTAYPVYHTIDTYQIYHTSQLVTKKTGMVIQANKAIVGANAFAHESGIHQDGVLKHKQTYEIIEPAVVGIPSNSLVLGKHSGRNAFRTRVEEITQNSIYDDILKTDATIFEKLFLAFKKLADTKKSGVTDQDMFALLDDQLNVHDSGRETYLFKSCQVVSGSGVLSTATVTIIDTTMTKAASNTSIDTDESSPIASTKDVSAVEGVERCDAAIGHGPVHAIFSAINRLIGFTNVLASYEVKAVTEGSDSLGRVVVRIHESDESADDEDQQRHSKAPRLENEHSATWPSANKDRKTYQGQGTDEDILVASAKAYINAVNRMAEAKRRMKDRKVPAARNDDVEVVGGSVEAVPSSRKVDV